jgi:transglutaminase-like putative cysteine protease
MFRILALAALGMTLTLVEIRAQKPPIKFGDVSPEEVKMSAFEPDSSAAAVVLADYGESEVQYNQTQGFITAFNRVTRVKILKKEGYEWGNFEILLYTGNPQYREKISGLKVVTYNLVNGKIEETKASADAIFQEEFNKDYDLTKVAAPNVKEGSVVEITYRINSESIANLQDWTFQSTIPVVWSEYRTHIPDFFSYNRYMQGYIVAHINEEKMIPKALTLNYKTRTSGNRYQSGGTQYGQEKIDYKEQYMRLVAKDVPAFKEEPFLTTHKDYVSKINFELAYIKFPDEPIEPVLGTWDDISRKLWEYSEFGGEIKGNPFLNKIVETVTSGAGTPEARISAIHGYVKTNVSWNGQSRMLSRGSLRTVLDEGKGSSADINLLLASMLAKAGLTVLPVLVSTRDHGFVRESIPILGQFNYVVCLVKLEGKQILLDATDKLLPTGVLPKKCLNGQGMVVDGKQSAWVDLEPVIRSRSVAETVLQLVDEGDVTCTLKRSLEGYPAFSTRESYLTQGEEEYVRQFLAGKPWIVNGKHFENAENITEPFRETYEISAEDQVTKGGDVLYINPILIQREFENPFKLEQREYPVDFGNPFEKVLTFRLEVPPAYQVDELPESKILMLPENSARYIFSVSQNGNLVTVTSFLSINKSIFTQLEYPNLREFYNQVVAKQAEQIILKKKL